LITALSWNGGDLSRQVKSPPVLHMDAHDFMKWWNALPSAAAWKKVMPIQIPSFGKTVTCMDMRGITRVLSDETRVGGNCGTKGCNSLTSRG
jgi:hypothetical protein